MAKPEGIKTGKKDNSRKHPYVREQWMRTKREGRPKQTWNPETNTWQKDEYTGA